MPKGGEYRAEWLLNDLELNDTSLRSLELHITPSSFHLNLAKEGSNGFFALHFPIQICILSTYIRWPGIVLSNLALCQVSHFSFCLFLSPCLQTDISIAVAMVTKHKPCLCVVQSAFIMCLSWHFSSVIFKRC